MSPLQERINSLVACVQATGEGTIDLPEMVIDEYICDSDAWSDLLLQIGVAFIEAGEVRALSFDRTETIGVVHFRMLKDRTTVIREIASQN